MKKIFESVVLLVGLSAMVSGFANIKLSPTLISNPHTIAPGTKEVVYLDVSGVTEGVRYDIECQMAAAKGSGGAYASFLSKNLQSKSGDMLFDGMRVKESENVVMPETLSSFTIKNVEIAADESIYIEDRDGKASITVNACTATPRL